MILNVARQECAKGLDVLLRAWTTVVERAPNGILLLAGRDGTRSRQLRQLVTDLGVESNGRFLGVRDDMPNLLCAADAFVLPSRREGLPGALLEAMALDVPIVATEIPTILEAVPGAEYAALVPIDDELGLAQAITNTLTQHPGVACRVRTYAIRATVHRGAHLVTDVLLLRLRARLRTFTPDRRGATVSPVTMPIASTVAAS